MPQERPNHYGHLLDHVGVHGDSPRRTSPRFPTIEEAAERRAKRNVILCAIGLCSALIVLAVDLFVLR